MPLPHIDPSQAEDAVCLGNDIWWVGHYMPEDRLQCHVYLIVNGKNSVLIDPGSKLTFAHTLRKIEQVIPFSHIRYFVCQHQDPDITAALPIIDQLVCRKDAVIVSHWRAIALLRHYGLTLPFMCVEEEQWKLDLGDRKLEFVFTPYLHFPGAFCTYDPTSQTLFSSDLFGGFTDGWKLIAEDESYFESMRPFHEHYMPSHDILYHTLLKLEKIPLQAIAPQHGSIIPKKLIPYIFSELKKLQCGIYLLTQTSTEVLRLSELNQMLQHFLKSIVTYREFEDIATALLEDICRVLPVQRLEFYTWEKDTVLHLAPETRYRGTTCSLPEHYAQYVKLDQNEWEEIYQNGLSLPGTDNLSSPLDLPLIMPLFSPASQKATGMALLHFADPVSIDQETSNILRQISMPLSVAVEREMIYRTMELERQRYYERSIRDPLTGLYTREYMTETMQRLLARHDRDATAGLAVIMLDLDHFKRINDTYGHNSGDEVLQAIASAIQATLRSDDIPIRLGGEEFAVFVVGRDSGEAHTLAERIRTRVMELTFEAPMDSERITVSCGVAYRQQQENLTGFMTRGDRALYRAKETGRDKVCVAGKEDQEFSAEK